jgi:molybdopterin-containing oxidoreductase family iron-sulfur binding subunit
MFDGFDFANLLVKTREGRPIKIDNNKIAGAHFAANARVHASVLSLYDSMRLQSPIINAKAAYWSDVNAQVKASLAQAKDKQAKRGSTECPSYFFFFCLGGNGDFDPLRALGMGPS